MSSDSLLSNDRERYCDRCERGIHDLEPAATVSFGGAIQKDELVVCPDCCNVLVDWWNARPDNSGNAE